VRRREAITLLGGAAAAWPFAARAQQTGKVPRVGILSPAGNEATPDLTAFRERLHDLGYVEGQTIVLDFRLSKGIVDALPALAAELVRVPVDVIVTVTTSATLAAFGATRTIPIVMATTGGDPIALGLAKSLSRPGGNVTGTNFLTGLSEKRLQLLKLAFPSVQRVAVLVNSKEAIAASEMRTAERAAVPACAYFRSQRMRLLSCRPSRYRVVTAFLLSRAECSGTTGRPSSALHRWHACPLFIQNGNTPTMAGSSPMGPMCLSISAKLPVTSIAFSTVPILAIFQSTHRQNSISSSTSGLPERLD
jgi:ABC transporter substrate binding protein